MAKWGRIIGVVEIPRVGRAGELEKWYRYTVETAKGITFTQEVPEADTTPERLEPILQAKAERLDKGLTL